ncbi:MAG TPA: methyl-accepting chemotaxis protein, partial [Burkholderiaceae bacterium]|nr:methyl-accepting chemotaxis protein [Burkholderiaceae bacterium]
MRNNQPVTQNEQKLLDDQTLISVTDLKGRITYANKAFISLSGYLEDELLGQPHNIVRHPDMPEEAFRDLWATIESGSPWSGLVKNRRKNGDFYWVRANATPMRDGDRIVGYLSVRTKPAEDEVRAAEGLYARMRQEAQSGHQVHVLERGRVVRAGLLARWGRQVTPGLRGRILWLTVLSATIPQLLLQLGVPPTLSMVCAWGAAVGAGLWIWQLMGAPLHRVVAQANRVAAGDLSENLRLTESGLLGELQQALAQVQLTTRTVVRDVRHEVGNLRGGTQEIAMGNNDISNRVESQASSIEQTAASMEQINGTVKQTTDTAAQGAELANHTLAIARRSHESVQAVTDTMQGIEESSRRIGDIIKVIEGVAFQTNILALNAAVEAARAGDAGRGFAVVAAEVRALAQRTSSAAKEIRDLIEESHRRVQDGALRAGEARARVDESMAAVDKVTAMLDGIRTATQQQLSGTSHITQALSDMDDITQQNAAMVEELAAASRSLNDQVDAVHYSIRVFRLFQGDKTLAEDDAVQLRRQKKDNTDLRDDEVDFDKVIAAHQQWRVTLRNAVLKNKKLDADTLRRDDCCALGKWLHGGGGRRWGHVPDFKALLQHHKAFHHEAGKVADAINQGALDRAKAMMESGTPFVQAGHHVTHTIRALRALAEHHDTPTRA